MSVCGLDMRTLLTDEVWQVFLSNFSFTAKFIYLGSPILGRVIHRLGVPQVDCLRMDTREPSSRNRKRALITSFHRRFLYFVFFDNSTAREKKKHPPPLKGLCHPTRMREPMKTNLKKLACLFQVLSEILEGCFYLSKSQPSFDS